MKKYLDKYLGKISSLANRQKGYFTYLNTLMIGYMFITTASIKWWFFIIILFWILFIRFDNKHILPRELDYNHNKSPFMQKLLATTETILEKIEKIEKR